MDNVLSISKMASINDDIGIKPGLDARRHIFVTRDGVILPIQKVSYSAVQELANNPVGRPKIPIKTVNYGTPDNPKWGDEAVPGDPVYLDEYKLWQDRNNHMMLVYIFATGVDVDVPDAYKQQQLTYFPDRTPDEIKYFYVTSLVNLDEVTPLIQAITGQTAPSEEGVNQAQADFPSNGKG